MNHLLKLLKLKAAILIASLGISCSNNLKEVQKVGISFNKPIGEADFINLNYTETESNKVKLLANLKSPKVLDYSNRPFAFNEFPKGIQLTIYDDEGKPTKVFADYAITYDKTQLIDLQGNVIIATYSKDTLFTEQLFYNQKIEWLFTNKPFYYKRTTGYTRGTGFNSDKSFKNFRLLEMSGDFDLQ